MPDTVAPRTIDTVYRHLSILSRIPRQPKQIQVADLRSSLQQDQIDVSVRTIQRDLVNLSQRFPIRSDKHIGHEGAVWYWEENAPGFEAPGMDASTALAMLAARDHLKPLLPKVTLAQLGKLFRQAEYALDRVTDAKLTRWQKKVFVLGRGPHLELPKVSNEVQGALEDAVLRNRKLRAIYRARGATKTKEHVLSPLGLVTFDGVQYLLAVPWKGADPGKFATHRFQSVEVLGEPAVDSSDFDLKRYIGEERGFSYLLSPEKLSLVLAVSPSLGQHLEERPLGKDQTQEVMEDRRVKVSVTADDTDELRWWLLGLGDQVEVTEPEALRDDMRSRLSLALKSYRQKHPRSMSG